MLDFLGIIKNYAKANLSKKIIDDEKNSDATKNSETTFGECLYVFYI